MNKHIFSCLLLFIGLFVGAQSASAAGTIYTWKGEGDGVTWTDPANWDQGSGYPGVLSSDIADFDGNGVFDPLYIDPGTSANPVIIPSSTPITIAQLVIASNNVTVYLNTNSNVLSVGIVLLTYTLNLSPTSKLTMLPGTGTGAGLNDVFVNAGTLNATSTIFTFNDYSYLYNAGALNTTTCTFNFSGLDAELVGDGGSSNIVDNGSTFNFTGNNDGQLYSITVYVSKTVGGFALKNGGNLFKTNASTLTFSGTYTSTGTPYAVVNTGVFILGPTAVLNLPSTTAAVNSQTTGANFTTAYFLLQSDATGSASIGKVGKAVGAFTGVYDVQRYIQPYSSNGYRLLSSPGYSAIASGNTAANLGTIAPARSFSTTGFTASYVGAATAGPSSTFSTNTTSGNGNPGIYLFDEAAIPPTPASTQNFYNGNNVGLTALSPTTLTYKNSHINGGVAYTASNAYINAGTGFNIFYFGPSTSPSPVNGAAVGASTITWLVKLNSGDVTFTNWASIFNATPIDHDPHLSYTPGVGTAIGLNLVGNPYACTIDLAKVGLDNATGAGAVSQTYYELTDAQTYTAAVYSSTGAGIPGTVATSGSGSQYIASGQGFYVAATAAGQTFKFKEDQKITPQVLPSAFLVSNGGQGVNLNKSLADGSSRALVSSSLETPNMHILLRKDSANFKSTGIYFNSGSPDAYNMRDAIDLDGISPAVYMSSFTSDNMRVAVNTMGSYTAGKNIKLYVNATTDGTYTLNLTDITNIDPYFKIRLIDNYKKDTVDFASANSSYSFNIATADPNSYGADRFVLSIKAPTYRLLAFESVKDRSSVTLNWKSNNEGDYTGFSLQKLDATTNAYSTLYNVQGNGSHSYSFVDTHPVSGVNTYRLLQNNADDQTSYTRTLSVNFSTSGNIGALSVYPNPARDVVTVNFNNVTGITSDIYNVNIYNSMGVLLMQKSISANSLSQDVSALKPGAYIIEVKTNYGNSIGNAKFVKN